MATNYAVVTNYTTTLSAPMTSSQLTVPVNSVTTKDGHVLTMADLGGECYLTLEPGTASEEIVKCTGISGLNWVVDAAGRGLAYYGDTDAQVVGNAKAHVAGAIVIMSNVKNVYERLMNLEGDQTAAGRKTFTTLPSIPVLPLLATDAASKDYVDNIAQAAGGISAFHVTKNGADPTLTVNVGAGYWMDGSVPVTFPGVAAFAVTASNTNYIMLAGDNTIAKSIVGFEDGKMPIAIVVANGTTITSISDARAWLTNADTEPMISTQYTYGGTIAVGDPLYLDSADGKLKVALATSSTTADSFFGIAIDAGVNNDTGKRVQIGGVVTVISGMTVGQQFLSDTGTMSLTPGTYRKYIGFAATTSTLFLQPGLRIENVSGLNSFKTTGLINGVTARFGGDGTDGALNVTSGTTTIDLANAEVVVKNYTSINVSSGATLAFSNPATNGTIVVLRCQGNLTIAGTINADSLGAAGGSGGAGGSFPNGTGVTGSVATQTQLAVTGAGGAGGVGGDSPNGGGGGGGAGGTFVSIGTAGTNGTTTGTGTGGAGGAATAVLGEVSRSSIQKYTGLGLTAIAPGCGGAGGGGGGSGGDGGETGGTGGAGGRGGGAIVIQAQGNAVLTSGTINARGADGSTGSGGGAARSGGGGGGGGAGGTILVYYNGTLTGSLTTAVTGGAGGSGQAGAGTGVAGGAGGAGGNGVAATIKNVLY